jgi:hypothetical protein
MIDEMDLHWKMPEHVPTDQYPLWALERVCAYLIAQGKRSADGAIELSDTVRLVWQIMEPMMRQVEEQGLDGFDAFLARHRQPAPEFGPHPLQPSLTDRQAENWWTSKTTRERFAALSGTDPDSCHEVPETVLVGFGKMRENVAVVSASVDWNELDDTNRAKLLNNMRKGWVHMPETIRSS